MGLSLPSCSLAFLFVSNLISVYASIKEDEPTLFYYGRHMPSMLPEIKAWNEVEQEIRWTRAYLQVLAYHQQSSCPELLVYETITSSAQLTPEHSFITNLSI